MHVPSNVTLHLNISSRVIGFIRTMPVKKLRGALAAALKKGKPSCQACAKRFVDAHRVPLEVCPLRLARSQRHSATVPWTPLQIAVSAKTYV